jgi:hypothetical protein
MRLSTDVAGACKEIVSRTAQKIQGRKYVRVEGWMAIATAHGCTLSACDVRQIEGGISARGLVRRISDGVLLGEAEGFVGDDEKTWSARTLHARRAMAQTRAMSRAARSVFAHVVVLMDAGLETTPAEEMDNLHEEKDITPPAQEAPKKKQSIEDKYIDKIISVYSSDKYDDALAMVEATKKLISLQESGQVIKMDFIREKMKSLFAFDLKNGKHKHNTYLSDIAKLLGMTEESETFNWHHMANLGAGR